jgi:site-specific DNA-cytosine methylase
MHFCSPPRWEKFVSISCDKAIEVGLLCVGLDSASKAGHTLIGSRWSVKWAYDVWQQLRAPLSKSIPAESLFIGVKDGDILKLDVSAMPSVQLICASPPCQPYSIVGQGKAENDPRAEVGRKVFEIIGEQAKRGVLEAFVIEQSSGIKRKRDHESKSAFGMYLERLRSATPNFDILVLDLNSTEFHLPQNRQRVYFIGQKKNSMIRDVPLYFLPGTSPVLLDFLDPKLENVNIDELTVNYRANMDAMKMELCEHGYFNSLDHKDTVIVFDIARKAGMGFGDKAMFNKTPTLRTKNMELFLVSLGGCPHAPKIQRFLHVTERIALQGFSPADCEGMSKCGLVKALGNACSVPVIGCVLAAVITNMCKGPSPKKRRIVGKTSFTLS